MTTTKNNTSYVALLRGINVGGNKKVDMKLLKEVFEKLGYTDVHTYINSGNVVFHASGAVEEKAVSAIEDAIETKFGFSVPTIVRSKVDIAALLKKIPNEWTNDTEQKTDVLFLWDSHDSKKTLALIKTTPGVDTLLYAKGAITWHVDREHYAKSGMHKFIGTAVYKAMTARNINTVRKLAELLV
jgi:uncharacterized protein (DUF1697 family)